MAPPPPSPTRVCKCPRPRKRAAAGLTGFRATWDQIKSAALRCGEAIRQGPREERIGNTVERGDAAGDHRNATRRAGVFWVVGSSKGLPVFPDTRCARSEERRVG